MHRYLVVAHKTLGGARLVEHLQELRRDDPYCTFHVVVPEFHPMGGWSDHSVRVAAQAALDEMLDRMSAMRIGATGEVGDSNPVYAVGAVLREQGEHAFSGIVLSTLPKGISRWWLFDVPSRMATAYPQLGVTHLIADEELAAAR